MTNCAERKARDSSLCVDALAGRFVRLRPRPCQSQLSLVVESEVATFLAPDAMRPRLGVIFRVL
jgi:hypothetical protein